MVQPEYRIYEMNKRLQSRAEVSSEQRGFALLCFALLSSQTRLCCWLELRSDARRRRQGSGVVDAKAEE